MTTEKLQEIINLPPSEAVDKLQVDELQLPNWKTDLLPQYDSMEHEIHKNLTKYPPKLNNKGVDEFRRISLAKQEETVNKVSQSMFYNDVIRQYDLDENSSEIAAKELLEKNYKINGNIDAINIERSKELFKCCQVATIWKLKEEPIIIDGITSQYNLCGKVYSPALGYTLYPYISPENTLIGISIYWKDSINSIDNLITYLPGAVISYQKTTDNWEQVSFQRTNTDQMPIVYSYIREPIWGGDSGTILIEILEEILSKNQMYIDKNTAPTYYVYHGEGGKVSDAKETSSDSRRVVFVGKDGFMKTVEWSGAGNALSWQFNTILDEYYQQVQVFNNSPGAMQKTPMSADNKEILLFDSKAKAKDLSGEFTAMFNSEFKIIRWLTGIQFPSMNQNLSKLSAKHIITPYSVKSKVDTSNYVQTAIAAGAMSQKTGIEVLNEVDNVENELDLIAEEQSRNTNNLL